MTRKRIILAANYSIIEPLGLFHLASVAKQEGWEPKVMMAHYPEFKELDQALREFKPDILGFTLYTGNHLETGKYFDRVRKEYPDVKIAVGGPHATYFPNDCIKHADYVVVSDGFYALRRILRGEVEPGIIHLTRIEPFPPADREQFYRDSPFHGNGPIKNVITRTGCPFSCTYCYNSSRLENIASALTPEQQKEMQAVLGPSQRLFPSVVRPLDEVIAEIDHIREIAPATQMIYFQDDLFGIDMRWFREFIKKYECRFPFHVNIRVDTLNPKTEAGRERLDAMREAGCTGVTLAIESASPVVRREVLDRNMQDEMIFDSMAYMGKLGYKVRTFMMLGLPRGATTEPTEMNLEADLRNLEFNVRLREATGLPNVAWASTLAPYRGTRIEQYCRKHGFYSGANEDINEESYRMRSALRFPREWVGPSLSPASDVWMAPDEEAAYKEKLFTLMNLFSTFARMPKGHRLARQFLEQKDQSFFGLSRAVRYHLYDHDLFLTRE